MSEHDTHRSLQPDIGRASNALSRIARHHRYEPTSHWNALEAEEADQYLICNSETGIFRGPWPCIALVPQLSVALISLAKEQKTWETGSADKAGKGTLQLCRAETFLEEPTDTAHMKPEKQTFWNRCGGHEPSDLIACWTRPDRDPEPISAFKAVPAFCALFDLPKMMDLALWAYYHKAMLNSQQILRQPLRNTQSKETDTPNPLVAMVQLLRTLENTPAVRPTSPTTLWQRVAATHRDTTTAYQQAFGHLRSSQRTENNQLFRHKDITHTLELSNRTTGDEHSWRSRKTLLVLESALILRTEQISYDGCFGVSYKRLSEEEIVKRFFARTNQDDIQARIEKCGPVMRRLWARTGLR